MSELAKKLIEKEKQERTGFLDLGNCGLTDPDTQIPELWELDWLEVLDFSNKYWDPKKRELVDSQNQGPKNKLSRLPKGLLKLAGLKRLVVFGLEIIKVEHLPPGLERLEISWNQISKLEGLPTGLRELYISLNQISKLEGLPGGLRELRIGKNQISKLEGLPIGLRVLRIGSNQIGKLEGLPSGLERLSIWGNQISKLEGLPGGLELLDVRSNKITDISPLLPFMEKGIPVVWEMYPIREGINVYENPLESPPPEIVQQGNEAILNYFKQMEEGQGLKEYLFEAKLLVIGEAGAGKTTFARRIKNPEAPMPKREESTHGIEIDKWDFPVQQEEFEGLKHKESTFFVNLWDFGGQEIYHATHQFFFSEKSLYVLLADTREQKTDFSYWLNTVEQLSGEDSILFVLLNRREGHEWNFDEPGYRSRFGEIMKEVYDLDLSDSDSIPPLQEKIKHWLKQLDGVAQPLIKSWVDIRKELAKAKGNEISLERFREICGMYGRTDEQDIYYISKYFTKIGVFTHYIDEPALVDTIYLNSNDLVKSVYGMLENELVKERKGRLSEADVDALWQNRPISKNKVLALLQKFGLLYKAGENQYLIPEHLPQVKPYERWEHEGEKPYLHFRYVFDKYMPKGLMSRLIVELHKYIPNHDLVWHRGVNLSHQNAHAEIVEQYGGTNQFDIRIVGAMRRDLLVIITQAFDAILSKFKKLDVSTSIKCPCKECAENPNSFFHKTRVIENALLKGKETIECQHSFEDVPISGLLALIDYRKVLERVLAQRPDGEMVRIEAMLEKFGCKLEEGFGGLLDGQRRLGHKIDTLAYTSLDEQKRALYDALVSDIESLDEGDLFLTEGEEETFFARTEKWIEALPASERQKYTGWQNQPVKQKLKLVLDFWILKYEREISLGKMKMPRSWKEFVGLFVRDEGE